MSDDDISRFRKVRKSSLEAEGEVLPTRLRTRALSQGNVKKEERQPKFIEVSDFKIEEEEEQQNAREEASGESPEEMGLELQLDGLNILEEEPMPPFISMLKSTSRCSHVESNENNNREGGGEDEFSFCTLWPMFS